MKKISVKQVEEAWGRPFATTAHQCHAVSLAIVKAKIVPNGRVARGAANGVGSQHSWVVAGDDVYDPTAWIVDATLWSYRDDVEGVVTTFNIMGGWRHTPHGYGSIWDWGQPTAGGGKPIELTPHDELSRAARTFLDLLGPLDMQGWMQLAHAPMMGWPSSEIVAAMYDTEFLRALIPIDIVGMLTDRNPQGLYLP